MIKKNQLDKIKEIVESKNIQAYCDLNSDVFFPVLSFHNMERVVEAIKVSSGKDKFDIHYYRIVYRIAENRFWFEESHSKRFLFFFKKFTPWSGHHTKRNLYKSLEILEDIRKRANMNFMYVETVFLDQIFIDYDFLFTTPEKNRQKINPIFFNEE